MLLSELQTVADGRFRRFRRRHCFGKGIQGRKVRVVAGEGNDTSTVVDLQGDQILALRRQELDDHTIALRVGLSLQTVRRYLRRSLMKDLSGTGNNVAR